MNQTSPREALRTPSAFTLALACLLSLSAAAALAQQPENANARRERTKRVTPLRTSDSQGGARVTITSDGELNDYSAYRSGDRFIVVIPQAEGGGGAAKGRGFEGAQVSRRGKDLVYTFKLAPGASARVNQRFNRLDVQFSAPKTSAQTAGGSSATASATPAATPRAPRTPPEIAGLPSPTPQARPTVDPRVVSEAAQQAANAQQTAATPHQNEAAPGFPTFEATPAPSPSVEPSAAPTASAEQIAQAQTQQQSAPGGAIAPPSNGPATTATLGSTLVNNWPWIIAVLLALGGVGLLFLGRLSSRRDFIDSPPPLAESPAPALRETKATPVARAATPLAESSTGITTAAPVVTAAATAATVAPLDEPRGKKKRKKGKGRPAAPQAPAAKAVPQTPAAEAAKTVEPVTPAGPGAPASVASKAGETESVKADEAAATTDGAADAAKVLAPAAAVAAASSEIEPVAPEVDSERVGAEVRSLLAGESYDDSVVASTDPATRQLVASELSAALTGRNAERKDRARAAFLAHGYFDDAARDLQSAEAPGRRAAAAQALALVGERTATEHLVAALEDPSADVRRAAVEALAELRDPAAVGPLEALRWRERSRQVPRQLIMRAVELCAEAETEEIEETTLARDVRDESVLATEEHTLARDERAPALDERSEETSTAQPPVEAAQPALEYEETADAASTQVAVGPEATTPFGTKEVAAVEPASQQIEVAPVAPVAAPSPEPSAVAETSTVEQSRSEVLDETFEDSVAVEAPAPVAEGAVAEGRAVESDESFALAGVADPVADVEPPVSLAGEETPGAVSEPAGADDAVYTFDEFEAAAWAERRAAPAVEAEEDLLAELDALESAGAESRAAVGAEALPSYVAPEFALRGEEPSADERFEPEIEEPAFEEVSSGAAERGASVVEPLDAAPASAAEVAEETFAPAEETEEIVAPAAVPAVTAASSGEVKSLDLFEGVPAAAQAPAEATAETDAAAETSFAIEPFRPEEAAARTHAAPPVSEAASEFAPTVSEEVGLAPAVEEPRQSRGLAAHDDAFTGLEAPRAEKGLSASLEDPAEISIIPKAIQLRLESDDAHERASSVLALARLNTDEAFTQICSAFDDRAEEVRDAAARALYDVSEDRAESFTRALREAPAERRRNIGAALASSGLAEEAVSQLTGESRDRTYDAFSLLFLMAKAGETAPLIRAIESHPDNEVRLAVVKLLALSGQQEVLPSFRRLAVRGSLPQDVRAAVMEAIYQIGSSGTAKTPAAKT